MHVLTQLTTSKLMATYITVVVRTDRQQYRKIKLAGEHFNQGQVPYSVYVYDVAGRRKHFCRSNGEISARPAVRAKEVAVCVVAVRDVCMSMDVDAHGGWGVSAWTM